jgi:2-hydroxycyclohexanecarboxyl-CoA dehydrogenase
VAGALAQVRSELGPVRILVNNAATWVIKFFKDTTPAEAEHIFSVTVTGTMNLTRVALPDLTAKPGGRIVNIISASGRTGEAYMSVYAGAKAAVVGLTKSLAKEVGRYGTTVNGVSPGTTNTPGSAAFIKSVGGEDSWPRPTRWVAWASRRTSPTLSSSSLRRCPTG